VARPVQVGRDLGRAKAADGGGQPPAPLSAPDTRPGQALAGRTGHPAQALGDTAPENDRPDHHEIQSDENLEQRVAAHVGDKAADSYKH
jgi:hypothetical protein